ncbi:MAG: ATP-binding protein [Anaerocolumna sp.]|jgi:predicted kinase|nr:ATP-binding protein [Anaerocolumna sp.]
MNKLVNKTSASKVILMCGPAGSGKSTLAKEFEKEGMVILSYDKESFKRGLKEHPLPAEIVKDIKNYLDARLISLIEQNIDIVLDYSFWSKEMRSEYISLLKEYNIEPIIYYVMTPKEVALERIRNRYGTHENDIMLTEQTASLYYDNFQMPTADEGEIIIVKGY